MKYKTPVCSKCKGELQSHEEKTMLEERKINKNGTISKKIKQKTHLCSVTEVLICLKCNTMFEYELDGAGRIKNIIER